MTGILIKIILGTALLLGLFVGGCHHGETLARAEQDEANEKQREEVAMIDGANRIRTKEADHAQEVKRQHDAAAVAALRSELDRMRQLASDRNLPGAARDPSLATYASDGDGLLADCSARYSELAGEATSLASRLGGLQSLVNTLPLKD